jgi:hypothetical protein
VWGLREGVEHWGQLLPHAAKKVTRYRRDLCLFVPKPHAYACACLDRLGLATLRSFQA